MEERRSKEKGQKKLPIFVVFGLVLFFVATSIFSKFASAATAPAIITYQGKLLISSRLATTTQSMYFILYDAASAGTVLYTASGTIGTPQAVSTTPSQGLFSINLGGTGTNALSQAIFQNNGSVYLEVRVGADTLTPRKQITAAPYALNSRYLDGVGVNTLSSTQYIPMSDSSGNFTFNSTTVTTSTISNLNILSKLGINSTSPVASLAVQGNSGTNLLEIASSTGASVLRILTNGNVGIGSSTPSEKLSIVGNIGLTSSALTFGGGGGEIRSLINSTTAYRFLSIQSDAANSGPLVINSYSPLFSGTRDPIMGWGYNMDSGGTAIQAGEPGLLWQVEGNYNDGSGQNKMESYLQYLSSTSTLLRPIFFQINRDTSAVVAHLNADSITFNNRAETVTNFSFSASNLDMGQGASSADGPVTLQIHAPAGQSGILALGLNGVNNYMQMYASASNTGSFYLNSQNVLNLYSTPNGAAGASIAVGVNDNSAVGVFDVVASNAGVKGLVVRAKSTQTANIFEAQNSGSVPLVVISPTGKFGIGTSSPIATLSVVATSSNGNNPIFEVASSSGASFLRILANGNVGIGTTTPVSKFSVVGTSTITGGILVGDGSAGVPSISFINDSDTGFYSVGGNTFLAVAGGGNSVQFSNGGFTTGGGGTAAAPAISFGGDTDTGFWAPGANMLGFTTNGINRFTVSTTAFVINPTNIPGFNFGIGTSTPIATFSVQGNTSSNPFSVNSSTGSSLLSILQNGNVGVNSSSPYATFSVQGDVAISGGIYDSTGTRGVNGQILQTNGTLTTWVSTTSLAISGATQWINSGSNIYFNTGNVGIGTSTPTEKLVVSGNISNIVDSGTVISQIATTSVGTVNGPTSIFVSGKYAYTANQSQGSMSVVDISNPSAPVQIATTSVGASAYAIFVSGRYAYVINNGPDTMSVVDISNPSAPREIATVALGLNPIAVYVSGRYAYVANQSSNNISVVDISNPLAPVQVATTSVGTGPASIYVSGRYAYTANNGSKNISVVDISNPLAPVQVSTVGVGSGLYSIYVSGRYAYTANYDSSTISVIDISNPLTPAVVASTSVGKNPIAIYVSGRYAYVADYVSNTISVVDVSSSTRPIRVASTSVGTNPISIYVSGRYAYTANEANASISVVDISGTEVTSLIAHSAEVGNLQSRNDIFAQGNIMAGTGLMVGAGGIMSNGALSVFASTTGATSSIFDISSAQVSSIFKVFANGNIGINSSSPIASLAVQGSGIANPFSINSSTGSTLFNILTNGNVGIGTTTPAGALSIASGQVLIPNGSASVPSLAFFANSNSGLYSNAGSVAITAAGVLSATFAGGGITAVGYGIQNSTNAEAGGLSMTTGQIAWGSSPTMDLGLRRGATGTLYIGTGAVGSYAGSLVVSSTAIGTSSFIAKLTIQGNGARNPFSVVTNTAGAESMFTILTNGNIGINTSTPTQKLSVVGNISNITDSGTVIAQVATTSVGPAGTLPRSIFISGRYAYTANYGGASMSIIDVSNPTAPIHIASTSVGAFPTSIFVSGRYAYTTNQTDNNISVIDISNPKSPRQIATTAVGAAPRSIYVSGRYAYVANFTDGNISVIDISNPSAPIQIATAAVGASPTSIYVSGRYAYTTNNGPDTISVVDVSNPAIPVQIATAAVGADPFSVYVSGRYAYVTNQTANTISVVDVSNPAIPVEVGTTTVGANPVSIFVSGRYAYTSNLDARTISVIDITSSTAPRQVVTTSVGTDPYSIYVSGRYAYVANYTDNSISVVDISGTEVSSLIAHSAEVGNLQSRNDIFAQGNIMAGTGLMVGAGGIMSNGSLTVFASTTGATSSIFDISSVQTSNIFKVFANGFVGIGTSTAASTLTVQGTAGSSPLFNIASSTGVSVLRVLANGNVGIGTSTPSQKLSVVGSISNIIDPSNVSAISQIASTSVGYAPEAVFVSGRFAYTVNSTSNTLSVVDISNPYIPSQISTTSVGTTPNSLYVSGRYAYVTNQDTNSISVVDVSNPTLPYQVATTSVGVDPRGIYVSGRYAYVTNFTNDSMSVVDISNPLAPAQVATTSVGDGPRGIYVSGRYAYVANFNASTISIIDISNPLAPNSVNTATVGKSPRAVVVSGRYAYVANNASNTISVVDLANDPIQVATTSVEGGPYSIYVSGRYAYVPNSTSNTISVVDISNPLAPRQVATTSVNPGPSSIYVSGRYAYVTSLNSSTLGVVDISGIEVTSIMAHSAEVGNLQSRNDIFAQGNIMAGTGLMVGAGGIMSQGALSVFSSTTGFAASSSIFSISSAQRPNIFRVSASGTVQIGTSTASVAINNYKLFVDAGATSSAGIGVNGYIRAGGFIAGTTTLDLAELYPLDPNCVQNGNCPQAGDVVCSVADGNSGFYIAKCDSAYAENSIGIVSGNPGFTLGGMDPDGNSFKPVALAGRVPIKVSNANGDIHFGDRLAPSSIPGVAMKATGEGKTIAMAMGDYTSADVGTVTSFVNVGWNNVLHKALTVDTNAKTLTVGSSTNPYNLIVTGNISLSGTDVVNKLSFATSTLFESNVGNFAGARAFIFNAINFSDASADNYIISVRSNNTPVFSVAANGDVHAKGNYYGASAVLGTSTNPGDLAERVDIAIDDTAEAGDVMVVDKNAPDTYRRSDSAYEQSVAGIISSNPTIVVGNGKTDYTAVMAMVGRVPVKVSAENGSIQRGDLLISASTTGFAMKYDPAKDGNNKMVAIIGVALEPLSTSTGKILTLIRTGWVYNRDQAITKTQSDIQQIATAQGIDLSSSSEPGNLNIENSNGQLSYVGGNLDLQNNSIINVAGIQGKDDKWRIDQWGNLIQKITTAIGDKETYGLQSSGKQEIIISGTSTLENGTRKIILTDLDQAIIDKTVPLKIQITPSGETKGVYVSERSYDSFVVKENENGISNSSFDWTVIAKLLSPDAVVDTSGTEQNNAPSGGSQGEEPPVSGSASGTPTTTTENVPDVPTTTPDNTAPPADVPSIPYPEEPAAP